MKMRSISILWLLLSVFIFSSCNTINQLEELTTSSDTMTIQLKQYCYNKKYNVRLKPDSVLSDSRCPAGALCFWEGNAQVQFDLVLHGVYHCKFNLNTSSVFQNDTVIGGVKYKLVSLSPGPSLNTAQNAVAYYAVVVASPQ